MRRAEECVAWCPTKRMRVLSGVKRTSERGEVIILNGHASGAVLSYGNRGECTVFVCCKAVETCVFGDALGLSEYVLGVSERVRWKDNMKRLRFALLALSRRGHGGLEEGPVAQVLGTFSSLA